MQTIKYFTGREYNGAQILEISVPAMPADELADVDVSFIDESRNIMGIVTLMAIELQRALDVGPAVLREYDAGRYSALDLI